MARPLASPTSLHPVASPAVELDHVTVRLGKQTVLDDLSVCVRRGELIGVIGPNGAGKTTLLRLVLGLQRPSRGSVEVLGRPARRGDRRIGYVPQHSTFWSDMPIRARDMVALGIDGDRYGPLLGGGERDRRVVEALRAVDALRYADAPVAQLSGGEQQRLMLAQALVGEPDLLLLDEPLANLDLRSRRAVVELVESVCRSRNLAVLFVAHDVNPLLDVMDKVLYLARGHGVMGTVEEVVQGPILSRLFDYPVQVIRAQGAVLVTGGDDCHA
jgi:zinc/manganese transport system ATP-binding protein